MKKHSTREAYYQRLRELGQVEKPLVKESNNRTMGTLIDYKRAADGVAYGIVKESHNYYIKKAGIKENPEIADFAYIGGLANITNYQYKKLSEADKQRNMILHTINETYSLRVSKTGSKKMLTEDKAGEEIEMAASKVDDLETATAIASEVPAEDPMPDFSGEPMGGEEPAPEMGGEEMSMDEPAPEGGEEPAPEMGGEETPMDEPAPEMGDEEEGETGELKPEDEKSLTTKQIEKNLGKLTHKIRETELTDSQIKSYVNSFLSAFKDKFTDVEIEDRKEMANKILKVVPDEEIEDLDVSGEESVDEGNKCSECGGFVQYAESRGYTNETLLECGEEEMANLVSGYATAHDEGQNEGDYESVALFIKLMPQVLDILKKEYGHEEYANQLTPYTDSLNETTEEEVITQINELWGGIKKAVGKVGGDIKAGAQKAGQAVTGAVQKAGQAVGKYATDVKQAYHTGEIGNEIKRLENVAQDLGKQVNALNTRLEKAGQQPVNVRSILQAISNQVGGGGSANLSKYGVAAEGVSDPANVEVQPNMIKEDGEDFDDDVDVNVDTATPEKEIDFAPAAQSLGVDVVKPEGAPTSEKEIEIKDSTVTITMNESEKKLRKYIRERLEEKTGLRKSKLTESKKSPKLKKLDEMIDSQLKLYESVVAKNEEEINESSRSKFEKIDSNDFKGVKNLLYSVYPVLKGPMSAAIVRALDNMTQEEKYQLLKKYFDNNGGTLRTKNIDGATKVVYASQSVKDKATPSKFTSGGTQGKTRLGGV